ncbi:ABC transporter substrate-binding protein [Streptomyces sp. NPDC047002]|uniref:ABC transporter substrate-binding protein n=1 Tax=Streptomyces sp. NPDC047002 TaxID=3155475 RepID=UPI003452C155
MVSAAASRRGFLGLAGALAATAALGACEGEPGTGRAAAPRRGGTLSAAFPGFGARETMDPHVGRQFVDMARHKAVFDKLVDLDDRLRPVPRLAERWQSNADLTVWRFTLRSARFHDGRPLTADDVLFTLARILDPSSAERLAKSSLSLIDLGRSRAVGTRTVELALHRPHAELPSLLAFTGTSVVSSRYRDPARPVGTGPFRFGSFTPGREFTGHRFDGHWGGAAHLDRVRILSAESEARTNALRAGETDYAHEVNATFARTVTPGSGLRIVSAPHGGIEGLLLKTDRPPFDDPEAALGLKLLADRPRLVDVVLGGRGAVANDMYGKGFAYYPDGVPQRERDVSEAKRLLRRSGALNRKLTLYTSTAAGSFVGAAHLFAQQAADAGLRITVTTGPPETYFTDILRTGTLTSHRSGAMPIPSYLAERLLSDAPQNATAWHHKDFDRDFLAAQSTRDTAERTRRYGALQRRLRDTGGELLWGQSDWLNAVSTRLHGVAAAPPNTVDWARFDTVWLA